jgi:hypothetical protein
MDGAAVWMGFDGFWTYDGAVRRLPCDVLTPLKNTINTRQIWKVHAGTNNGFGEVTWFYPTGIECDSHVSVNEDGWSMGSIARTTWIDTNTLTQNPMATGRDGALYAHERGTLGDGQPISYHLESFEFEIESGMFTHVSKYVPDWTRIAGDHTIRLSLRAYPERAPKVVGPFAASGLDKKSIRARARLISVRHEGNGDFRLGTPKLWVTSHGARP